MATGYYVQDHQNPNTPAQYGWPRNRVSGVVGIHTAENNTCFNGPDRGDVDVADFIANRGDFGSYHVLVDADSINPLIHPYWSAWADTTNNAHAMSVSAAVAANDWLKMDVDRRRAVVINMAFGAAQLVQTAVDEGLLAVATPARRITAAEAISGSRAGFYGHGETNPGTRYDPGKDFDWNLFLTTYASAIRGEASVQDGSAQSTKKAGFLMALTDAQQKEVYDRIMGGLPAGAARTDKQIGNTPRLADSGDVYDIKQRLGQALDTSGGDVILRAIFEAAGKTTDDLRKFQAASNAENVKLLEALAKGSTAVNPAEIANQVIAAMGEGLAAEVVQELSTRLGKETK